MDDLCHYANRPTGFLLRYVKLQPLSHLIILICVLAAVGCSVSTQFGIKFLVDSLSKGVGHANPWTAFALLCGFIAADNLLWRVAGWIAASSFVRVTGDMRREMFQHLMGHSPSYFSNRLPGMLTSRITATSNAAFTIENMFIWNVLPPCVATVGAIAFIAAVNLQMAAVLSLIAGIVVAVIFRVAAKGRPIHQDFAEKAAAVDGEMADVVGNVLLVKAFGGFTSERNRFAGKVGQEMGARRRSLRYLEKLRLFHALATAILVAGLLGWAIMLWQHGAASTGTVVLVCTLGVSVLAATRDLAVALVDITQHMASLAEALRTLLVPHELGDRPGAVPLARAGAEITFQDVSFHYPRGPQVIKNFSLHIRPGEKVGLAGPSGGGKSTLLALMQRMHDVQTGRILIDGQDIAMITQESLRAAIAVVPQDISLFHRSLIENIRYSRPDASDDEVMKAAAAAHCDFIDDLSDGFNTMVGDRGLKLSGGQRQRIALARAFLKDSPILLLDEATSALDHESEEAIREASVRLMKGRTVIAIAHRLTTLRDFDRIVMLQDGELVQDGPPGELIDANGHYSDFARRKMMARRKYHDHAAGSARHYAIDA